MLGLLPVLRRQDDPGDAEPLILQGLCFDEMGQAAKTEEAWRAARLADLDAPSLATAWEHRRTMIVFLDILFHRRRIEGVFPVREPVPPCATAPSRAPGVPHGAGLIA